MRRLGAESVIGELTDVWGGEIGTSAFDQIRILKH